MNNNFKHDPITEQIIGCCFKIHTELGPGFSERIYAKALHLELQKEKITFQQEREFKVYYSGLQIGKFRCDLFVENSVIVELKAVTGFLPKLFQSQLLTYLKASKVKTGLLINFGNTSCEIKRLSV
ncbi:MAG: GxxExxY protein [Sphingobacteriaceae bacterium]